MLQGKTTHIEGGNLMMLLELWQETSCSSRVALGTSGTSYVASGKSGQISRCEGFLGIPLESLQENRASSRVEVENSGFISSCEGHLGELLEVC